MTIQLRFAVDLDVLHQIIKKIHLDLISQDFLQDFFTFFRGPKKGKNLIHNVRLRIFFDKAFIAIKHIAFPCFPLQPINALLFRPTFFLLNL